MYIIGKRVKVPAGNNPNLEDQRIVFLSAKPCRQPDKATAIKEAERLARENQEYEFLIFELIGGVEVADNPLIHRKYS